MTVPAFVPLASDDDPTVEIVVYRLTFGGPNPAVISQAWITRAAAYVRRHHTPDGDGFISGADFDAVLCGLVRTGHEVRITVRNVKGGYISSGDHPAPAAVRAAWELAK